MTDAATAAVCQLVGTLGGAILGAGSTWLATQKIEARKAKEAREEQIRTLKRQALDEAFTRLRLLGPILQELAVLAPSIQMNSPGARKMAAHFASNWGANMQPYWDAQHNLSVGAFIPAEIYHDLNILTDGIRDIWLVITTGQPLDDIPRMQLELSVHRATMEAVFLQRYKETFGSEALIEDKRDSEAVGHMLAARTTSR